jgi:hypothetical protein
MNGPNEWEANYVQGGYRGGGFRGNYYVRSSGNWKDRQQRDNNRDFQPRTENQNPTNSNKKEESDFEKMMREFVNAQRTTNEFVKTQFFNLKTKVEQGQKNHQASIQDLEQKFGRLSDQFSSRIPGTLPSNTQSNPKPSGSNDKNYRPPHNRNGILYHLLKL